LGRQVKIKDFAHGLIIITIAMQVDKGGGKVGMP